MISLERWGVSRERVVIDTIRDRFQFLLGNFVWRSIGVGNQRLVALLITTGILPLLKIT